MTSSPITIIGTPISHYVQTVSLTCEEKGVPYTLQVEGHDTPSVLRSQTHLQLHPFGRIPACQIEHVKLYETSAICRYIDQTGSGPSLIPDTPLEAALMEQWISAINSYYHKPCISMLVGQYVFPRGEHGRPDQQTITPALHEIGTAIQQLARAYQHNSYLAGENISLADLLIAPILMQMLQTPEGRSCIERFPVIEEKLTLIVMRPSIQKVAAIFRDYLPDNHRLSFA